MPIFDEEGYFNLRPFYLVEDLHEMSNRSIIGVNWFVILKIIKRSYSRLLSSRDSNLNIAKRLPYDL